MISRKEIIELAQGLPMDATWLQTFMERLKAQDPDLHAQVMSRAKTLLEELDKEKPEGDKK